jgi:hypothetical protein
VEIAGITIQLEERWMQQMARNATMDGCGTLRDCRYLLHDRDTKYTLSFRAIIESGRGKTLALPARTQVRMSLSAATRLRAGLRIRNDASLVNRPKIEQERTCRASALGRSNHPAKECADPMSPKHSEAIGVEGAELDLQCEQF